MPACAGTLGIYPGPGFEPVCSVTSSNRVAKSTFIIWNLINMNVTISAIQITDQGAGTVTCSAPDGELLTIRVRDYAHWMEICHD